MKTAEHIIETVDKLVRKYHTRDPYELCQLLGIKKYSNIGRNTDMKTVKISLNSIDKVKSFVNDLTKFDTDFDLVSGRYVIDAKSIMGIFSLDLSKPIDLNIHDGGNTEEILTVLAPYIIEA